MKQHDKESSEQVIVEARPVGIALTIFAAFLFSVAGHFVAFGVPSIFSSGDSAPSGIVIGAPSD